MSRDKKNFIKLARMTSAPYYSHQRICLWMSRANIAPKLYLSRDNTRLLFLVLWPRPSSTFHLAGGHVSLYVVLATSRQPWSEKLKWWSKIESHRERHTFTLVRRFLTSRVSHSVCLTRRSVFAWCCDKLLCLFRFYICFSYHALCNVYISFKLYCYLCARRWAKLSGKLY